MTPNSADHGWSQHHGSAVRAAAPEVPELSDAERTALWERIESTPSAEQPRRRRWKLVVAAAVVAMTVGLAGVAAAGVFSAHTGKGPSDAEDLELGGPGERLDPLGPDFAAILEKQTRDIRFPSDAARQSALSWEVSDETRDPTDHAIVSTGALRMWVAWHAVCAWSNEWAVALKEDDAAGVDRAAAVIAGSRHWTAITDTDPEMTNESESDWLPGLISAVQAGDTRAARKALFGNQSCMPGLAPALGLGKRW